MGHPPLLVGAGVCEGFVGGELSTSKIIDCCKAVSANEINF